MKLNRYLLVYVFLTGWIETQAQIDSTLLIRKSQDSIRYGMNMDAVYNRPFLSIGKAPVSLGGYVEANWQHLGTNGISEGNQFQFRRLTLFMSSSIGRKLKFLSEIEFEDGTKEISIEFAALDIEFHPLLNIRGGIILNPIGAFNQNHDGPKWEFTDRPISATQMLPATWSNAGFGLYGKYNMGDWMMGYEAYLSGGFDGSIIDNEDGRTSLAAAKKNPDRFEETQNGEPLYTAKLALRRNKLGEIGVSYMGGIYNKYQDDGLTLDQKRRVDVAAVDFNTTIPKLNTFLTGEWTWVLVDVPSTYTQQYGNKQYGGFIDLVQPIVKRRIFEWNRATVNLACRLEYVDWNVGHFSDTGGKIGDEFWSIMPGFSFRPVSQTVLRLNYRFMKSTDVLNNDLSTTSGLIFGISTYF